MKQRLAAQHYEITVSSSPTRAPVQSLAAIVKAFAEAALRGDARWRRGVISFDVKRVRFNSTGTRAILLLHYANAATASVASAHLVVDLTPSPNGDAYQAIVQETPGLTKASLEQGMQELARRLFPFYFTDASRKFRQAHPRLSFAVGDEAQLALEREPAHCEAEIRADISVKLDALLRRRAVQRAA